jgi:uncharacterized protein YutE (UPF0331/DUF86 family)
MVRVEVVRKRLNKLDEYLTILRNLQEYSLEVFVTDPERYGSAERFLQLAIETVTDLGNHVIADEALGIVNWHSDIPSLLAEHGYINADMKETWIKMIGFRNILVHDYLDIDRSIVYQVLQEHLHDIEALRRVFAQFL